MATTSRLDPVAILMGMTFALIWSSAFTSARIIVAEAPPLTALALRFTLAGALAVILARVLGQSWRLTRGQWRATLIFGVFQNIAYLGLNFVAMQTVEASLAAIIASSLPLLVAMVGWLRGTDRLAPLGVAGLAAGFVGVALIMGARLSGGAPPGGVALCILGVLSLTIATLAVRGASSGGNVLMVVGLQMLVGGAGLWLIALPLETWEVTLSWRLGAAFLYTLLMPGLVATLIWFRLVGRIGPTRAATFHFLNPAFGVAIAAVLLGEALRTLDIVGVAVITAGILAVQLARQPQAVVSPSSPAAGDAR